MDKAKRLLTPKALMIGAAVLIVVLAAVSGFLFWKYMGAKNDSGSEVTSEESQRVIERVSELYVLPENEEPTVAQVKDKTQLADQPFFDVAKDGDYVLIYQKAKTALLYRESVNKLVKVGPVNFENQQNGQAAGATTESPASGSPEQP
jgi:hypothetical protein